jgi:hypothetical protein
MLKPMLIFMSVNIAGTGWSAEPTRHSRVGGRWDGVRGGAPPLRGLEADQRWALPTTSQSAPEYCPISNGLTWLINFFFRRLLVHCFLTARKR